MSFLLYSCADVAHMKIAVVQDAASELCRSSDSGISGKLEVFFLYMASYAWLHFKKTL